MTGLFDHQVWLVCCRPLVKGSKKTAFARASCAIERYERLRPMCARVTQINASRVSCCQGQDHGKRRETSVTISRQLTNTTACAVQAPSFSSAAQLYCRCIMLLRLQESCVALTTITRPCGFTTNSTWGLLMGLLHL